VYGGDAVFQFFNKVDVTGYLLKSSTPGVSTEDVAKRVSAGWRDNVVSFGAEYEKVGDNFNPEVGFIRRPDMSHYAGDFAYNPRVRRFRYLRDYTLSTAYDYYAGTDGKIETRTDSQRFNLEFANSASFAVSTTRTFERLRSTFVRYAIPAGDYEYREQSVSYNSDRSRLLGGRINYTWGEFWNGTRRAPGGDVTFKPNHHWQIDLTYSRNDITVQSRDFITTLVGLKILYAFTSRTFLNTFLQYNSERRQLSSNLRFNIIHHPLSDIYLVFNERRDTTSGKVLDRGLIFKFTNLFNF
jgi:hypothetical protein